jgi:hypothetical protein
MQSFRSAIVTVKACAIGTRCRRDVLRIKQKFTDKKTVSAFANSQPIKINASTLLLQRRPSYRLAADERSAVE